MKVNFWIRSLVVCIWLLALAGSVGAQGPGLLDESNVLAVPGVAYTHRAHPNENGNFALDTVASELPQFTLKVRAYIDGRSHLVVQGDTVYWYHLDFAAPGRHSDAPGGNAPTFLNGTEWCPGWPGDPPDLEPCAPVDNESRDCYCDSSSFVGIPPLADQDQTVALNVNQGRGTVSIVQQPEQKNDFTLIVEFDDNPLGGPAWYEISLMSPPSGKIVVNNDEWALSDEGFPPHQNTDATQFALNVADWFTGGPPGNFLVYSTPFGANSGLVGLDLADTMENAGHTWTITSTTTTFSLTDLLPYDAIFLAGSQYDDLDNPKPVTPPDTQILIDYVKAGGNVYLAGGTDPFGYNDPDAPAKEAAQWNPFLNACGLEFAPVQNYIAGTLQFNSNHPIFQDVSKLYQGDGNSIYEVTPSDPNAQAAILVQSEGGEGLYAVCSLGGAIDRVPTVTAIVGATAVELRAFTAQAGSDHVTLAWETGSELDNEGFNLWRSGAADGGYTQINAALIPAQGDADTGASYTYTDADVVRGALYYYRLEDVDMHGASAFHGPVWAMPGERRVYLPLVLK